MALGKTVSGECGMRLRSIPALGKRKRIVVRSSSSCICCSDDSVTDCDHESPSKVPCFDGEEVALEDVSLFETLPQDILIKIVCGVDHEDIRQLVHVSKTIREATIIAKTSHFAYKTPSKLVRVIRNSTAGLLEMNSNRNSTTGLLEMNSNRNSTSGFLDMISNRNSTTSFLEMNTNRNSTTNSNQTTLQVPNAPKQKRVRRTRRDKKLLDEIRVALFAEDDGDDWWAPRDGFAWSC